MEKTLADLAYELEFFKKKIKKYAQEKHWAKTSLKYTPDHSFAHEDYNTSVLMLYMYRAYYKETCQEIHDLIPYR